METITWEDFDMKQAYFTIVFYIFVIILHMWKFSDTIGINDVLLSFI